MIQSGRPLRFSLVAYYWVFSVEAKQLFVALVINSIITEKVPFVKQKKLSRPQKKFKIDSTWGGDYFFYFVAVTSSNISKNSVSVFVEVSGISMVSDGGSVRLSASHP